MSILCQLFYNMGVLFIFIDTISLRAGKQQKGDLPFQFNKTQESSNLISLLLIQSSDTYH